MQEVLDEVYTFLSEKRQSEKYIWDVATVKRWERKPATEKQLKIIQRRCKGFNAKNLTKGEASQILNRLFA